MGGSARAATTVTVKVGAGIPRLGYSARMYAPEVEGVPTLSIHKGDTINLQNGAALLPVGMTPDDAYPQYAYEIDSRYGLIATDPDPDLGADSPVGSTHAKYKINLGPQPPTQCGGDVAGQCIFDGKTAAPEGILSPGDLDASQGKFYVRIDADAGSTVWSLFGPPSQHTIMRIMVVPDAAPTTSQAAIDDAFTKYHDRDIDSAQALDAKLNAASGRHKTKTGKIVWDAYAGFDTEVLRIFRMYPGRIVVHEGETVRWHYDQLEGEIHTATFPLTTAADLASNTGFVPVCDLDGDQGVGNDSFTVDFETFTCPDGLLEVDVTSKVTAQHGNGSLTGTKDFESSGLRGNTVPSGPELVGGEDSWDLTFPNASDAKGYRYACAVHGKFMSGTVIVKR
jgi:hypothetical protein